MNSPFVTKEEVDLRTKTEGINSQAFVLVGLVGFIILVIIFLFFATRAAISEQGTETAENQLETLPTPEQTLTPTPTTSPSPSPSYTPTPTPLPTESASPSPAPTTVP